MKGDWNGLVDATPVREHLEMLSKLGIGTREVADIAGVGRTFLQDVKHGRQAQIRARNGKAVLAVTPEKVRNDATLIPAAETWGYINRLRVLGYTKGRIALALGKKTAALTISKTFVTAKTARKVKRLYERVLAERAPTMSDEIREELEQLSTRAEAREEAELRYQARMKERQQGYRETQREKERFAIKVARARHRRAS